MVFNDRQNTWLVLQLASGHLSSRDFSSYRGTCRSVSAFGSAADLDDAYAIVALGEFVMLVTSRLELQNSSGLLYLPK